MRNAGRAYLFNPSTGALLQTYTSATPSEERSVPFGRIRGSDFGYAVAGMADVDGDGRGEAVVGAPGEWTGNFDADPAPYDGRVYLYRSGAPVTAPVILRSPNAARDGGFGNSLLGAPDLTGDGKADFVVGAPGEDLTSAKDDEGRVYVYSGASGQAARALVSSEPTDESAFGAGLALVPDMNRNGVPEIAVSDPTQCCDKMPAFYVFDGATSALLYSVELPYIDWDLNGLAGLPDLDGDGRGEVAAGVEVGSFDGLEGAIVFSGDLRRNEVEPNDNDAQAQILAGPSPRVVEGMASGSDYAFGGGVSIAVDGTRQPLEDNFRVDLSRPGLAVTLTGMTREDCDLYVFSASGAVVGSSARGAVYDDDGNATRVDDEAVSLPALPAGTYYIAVDLYGQFGGTNNAQDYTPYTLTVTGALGVDTPGEDGPEALAGSLGAPRPNPFHGASEVPVTLDAPGPARLSLVDVLGREVAVLFDGEAPAGTRLVPLDARGLAAGVYVLRLETPSGVATRRVTRAR